jgi:hypothetical protein
MNIKEIRFERTAHGWTCIVDQQPFHKGPTGRGEGCCRPIALHRAKRALRKALRG